MLFCPQCGANVADGTPVCPQCGVQLAAQTAATTTTTCTAGTADTLWEFLISRHQCRDRLRFRRRLSAKEEQNGSWFVWHFLGFGVHNFYLGYTGKAVAQLFDHLAYLWFRQCNQRYLGIN